MGATWMGFAVVGGTAMAAGGGVMIWALQSLTTRTDLRFPATRDQLGKDREWLDQQFEDGDKTNSGN